MVSLLMSWILMASATPAEIIIVKPGEMKNFARQDWNQYRHSGITVQCKEELKCRIGYEYVGKKYSLAMPNGKNYAYYKEKDEALSAGAKLVTARICDRLELNVDNDELVSSSGR